MVLSMLIVSALYGARSQEFHSPRHMCCDNKSDLIWFSNSFNICAPGTSDDDEELVFAASQCEAQLNTGVAYDTNAHIKRMFCENIFNY